MFAGFMAAESSPEDRLAPADFLPLRLAGAARAVEALLAAACQRFGLSVSDWTVLTVLSGQDALEFVDLARQSRFSEPIAREAVAGLIGRGLMVRLESALAITADGAAAQGEVARLALATEAALLSGLSPAEVKNLSRLLSRLEAAALKLTGR